MPDWISDEVWSSRLKTKLFGRNHYFLESIDSTNRFARKLAADGAPEGTLVFAETQTRGRGRWGRTWESHPGQGLQFSIILRPEGFSASAPLLTLAGAVSVSSALEEAAGCRFSLQWPNDVMHHGKKIAGVLTETLRNRNGIAFAVVGVGLNVNQSEDAFSLEIRDKASSLFMISGKQFDRFELLPQILVRMESDYREVQSAGNRFILERWAGRSNLIDKQITLKVHDGVEKGRVRGFHANGDLILHSEDGRCRRFSDGHVLEVRHAVGD